MSLSRQLGVAVLLFNLGWTAIFVAAYFWGAATVQSSARDHALTVAKANFEKDLAYGRWVASNGGIYVPSTDEYPPNPFLKDIPERDLTTPSGKELTLFNPAYMLRKVYELNKNHQGVLGHITSLNLIRPENKPDDWEREVLAGFEKGSEVFHSVEQIDGKPYLRYMKRLVTEKRCLKCHAAQGYREGDVRGGISVSVPLDDEYYSISSQYMRQYMIILASIWGLGMFLFNFGANIFKKQIRQSEKSQVKLELQRHLLSRYHQMVSTADELMAFVDTEYRYLAVNDAFLKAYELKSEEIVGITAPELLGQEVFEKLVKRHFDDCLAGREVRYQDWFQYKKKGRRFMDVAYYTHYQPDGCVGGVVASIRDITAMKEAEEQAIQLREHLRQAQKMETIGTLAGGIAHDFNNILGAILGYAEMIQEDCPPGSTMRKDIDRVVEAGNRAKELVKQILVFSRQTEVEERALQPGLIIKEVVKMLRASLPATINIKVDLDPGTGLVLADPIHVHQVVSNLCTNAFHAMEEKGGTLTISLKNKVLTREDVMPEPQVRPGTFVEIGVNDTGSGMTPEIIDKMFDPYFTTKDVGKGTGMGLAIIHGIVKKAGGFVSCRSRPGEGTMFRVYLPVYQETDEGGQISALDALSQQGNEHILFVDDEKILAEMTKTMLERLGYRVTVETSSLEALQAIQREPYRFDLMITDQTMPGMTGFDLARRVLQIRPGLPVILCTGFSNTISEEKAKSYGIKGFALKPLNKKDLAGLVRRVLDSVTNPV